VSIEEQSSGPNKHLHVAILLCAYNGERFIEQQLDSIAGQTYENWKVWVSDDGSTDRTHEILAAYRARWGADRLEIVLGPGRGFAANFLSIACLPEIQADCFAYCDQDDIWEKDKIARALAQLEQMPMGTPGLYCSRTTLVNEAGKVIGLSPLFRQAPDFRNALVQNVGGGNTMVFNQVARQIVMAAGADLQVVAHDWWTYVAVTAAGGVVVYDAEPSLLYRQHGQNLIGSNNSKLARILRLRQLMQGQLRGWIDQNVDGIRRIAPRLVPQNQAVLEAFLSARRGGALKRMIRLKRSGVYRQTFVDNVGMYTAAFFKKL